jgi:hypothetical protein
VHISSDGCRGLEVKYGRNGWGRTRPMQSKCVACAALRCPLIAQLGCPWWLQMRPQGLPVQAPANGDTWQECMVRPASETCEPQTYDCPVAAVCVWQNLSGPNQLCPPREALSHGFDPRVCLFEFPRRVELDPQKACEG